MAGETANVVKDGRGRRLQSFVEDKLTDGH